MASRLWSPEERANRLLLKHLTKEQKQAYEEYGYFDFTGSKGGKYRLVKPETLANCRLPIQFPLIELDEANPRIINSSRDTLYLMRCIYSHRSIPEADLHLALKVLIEADERNTNIGCTYGAPKESVHKMEKEKADSN